MKARRTELNKAKQFAIIPTVGITWGSYNCDDTTAFGKCGYGCICDYCEDNSYGRPCVRALNALCRDKHITIDYQDRNFEEVFAMADRTKGDKK
jgi:hypothetical protein